ncbi:MAG: PEP-CTERM sorting domain-containing protein [Candidatus Omnitrophica bacterium]|nr:PEP-CTERM sorting domain-containing protein [Candidatus Omnitrophota bacterium]
MKKRIVIAACLLATVAAYAQGAINFSNHVPYMGVDAPIFAIDGMTKLAGTGYLAELYAGRTTDTLVPIGDPLPFRTGDLAGYLVAGPPASPTDPLRIVPGITGGVVATVQVRAWDVSTGATWDAATIRGQSVHLTLTLGFGGLPPVPPADLLGLRSFSLQVVPEPSTMALGLLGACLLLLWRRK